MYINMSSSTTYSDDREINWTGKILKNKYALIQKIGKGSYASVWLSYNCIDKKYCVVKINNKMDYKIALNESENYKFIKKFNNDYLMEIIDHFDCIGQDEDTDKDSDDEDEDGESECTNNKHHCIVLDVMACSLYDLTKTKKFKQGMDFKIVLNIIKQSLNGLVDLHKNNIIHGDFKPENILITGTSLQHKKIIDKLDFNKVTNNNKNNKNNKKNKNNKNKNNNIKYDEKYFNNISEEIIKKCGICDSDSEYSDMSDSDNNSEISYFSDDFKKIEINNDNYSDILSDDFNDSDCDDKYNHIDLEDLSDIKIKITDFGESLLPTQRKKREVHTCYYKSPEILLRFNYDTSSDMWALGCTIIELLTGKILFDADDYDGNNERHHLYLITKTLGQIPNALIEYSPKKDVYFTKNKKLLKGYEKINFDYSIYDIIDEISIKNNLTLDVKNNFTDFILKIFDMNKYKRLTSRDALIHKLFN